MTQTQMLTEELRALPESFASHELAYLALTVKAETAVRDRLAFRLHRRVDSDKSLVVREWHKTDLAVLRDSAPWLLLELCGNVFVGCCWQRWGASHLSEKDE